MGKRVAVVFLGILECIIIILKYHINNLLSIFYAFFTNFLAKKIFLLNFDLIVVRQAHSICIILGLRTKAQVQLFNLDFVQGLN